MSGLTHPPGSVHKEPPSPAEPAAVHPPEHNNTNTVHLICQIQVLEEGLKVVFLQSELHSKFCQFKVDLIPSVNAPTWNRTQHKYLDINISLMIRL